MHATLNRKTISVEAASNIFPITRRNKRFEEFADCDSVWAAILVLFAVIKKNAWYEKELDRPILHQYTQYFLLFSAISRRYLVRYPSNSSEFSKEVR